jgi:hypothetical protein
MSHEYAPDDREPQDLVGEADIAPWQQIGDVARRLVRRKAILADLPRSLRMLARYVDRLSPSQNPDTFVVMKDEIGATLTSLATVLEIERREQGIERARSEGLLP